MKKFLFLLMFLFPMLAFPQTGQRINTALSQTSSFAKVIPGASIFVCTYNLQNVCTTPIGIYSDPNLSSLVQQPLVADGNGVYYYYIQANTKVIEKVCAANNQCTRYPILVGGSGGGSSTGCDNLTQVCDVNGIFGSVVLQAGTNVTLDRFGNTITINSTGSGCNPADTVCSTNGLFGDVTLTAGANVTITPTSIHNLTISSSGGGGGSGPALEGQTAYFDTTTSIKGSYISIPAAYFGVICDGTTDTSANLQTAFDFLYDNSYAYSIGQSFPKYALEVQSGVCVLGTPINYRGESFHGVSRTQTAFKPVSDAFKAPDRADSPSRSCCFAGSDVHSFTILLNNAVDQNTTGDLSAQQAWAAQGRGGLAGSIFANTFAGWSGITLKGALNSSDTTIPITQTLDLNDYHSGIAFDGHVKIGTEYIKYHGITTSGCPNSAPTCLLHAVRGETLAGLTSTAASHSDGDGLTPLNPLAPNNTTDWIPLTTVGACGFVFPARDGTHPQGSPFQHGFLYNLYFTIQGDAAWAVNNTCAFYMQAGTSGSTFRDIGVNSIVHGIIQAPPFANTDAFLPNGNSSDKMVFDDLDINASFPFVFFSGRRSNLSNSQFFAGGSNQLQSHGMTLYTMPCHTYGTCVGSGQYEWNINGLYQEWNDGGGAISTFPPLAQIAGDSIVFNGQFMNAGGPIAPLVWDANNSVANKVVFGGIQMNGYHNTITTDHGSDGLVENNGLANDISIPHTQYGNRPYNIILPRPNANKLCSDFLIKGAVNGDWFQCQDDLFNTAADMLNTPPAIIMGTLVKDSSLGTGEYIHVASPGLIPTIGIDAAAMTLGQRYPRGKGWAYIRIRSGIATTQVIHLGCQSGNAGVTTASLTGAWQTIAFRYDMSIAGCPIGGSGGYFQAFATSPATTIDVEWEGIVPDFDVLTVNGVLNSLISTPASSSAACNAGDWAHDTGFIYTCVAANTWKRVAISTW